MGNTVQLKKNGQPVFPVTDVSLVMGLQDAIKLPPVKVTTLPTASAETAGKMYYVGPDANDEYERYITSATNGSYEWIDLGDTSIPLPSIADNLTTDDANTALSAKQGKVLNEKLGELEAEVTDEEIVASTIWVKNPGRGITTTGSESSSNRLDIYVVRNTPQFKRITGTKGVATTGAPIVACYSDDSFTSANLLARVDATAYWTEQNFALDIPSGTKFIVVVGDSTGNTPTAILTRKIDVPQEILSISQSANLSEKIIGKEVTNLLATETLQEGLFRGSDGAFIATTGYKAFKHNIIGVAERVIHTKIYAGGTTVTPRVIFYEDNGVNSIYPGGKAEDVYLAIPKGVNAFAVNLYSDYDNGRGDVVELVSAGCLAKTEEELKRLSDSQDELGESVSDIEAVVDIFAEKIDGQKTTTYNRISTWIDDAQNIQSETYNLKVTFSHPGGVETATLFKATTAHGGLVSIGNITSGELVTIEKDAEKPSLYIYASGVSDTQVEQYIVEYSLYVINKNSIPYKTDLLFENSLANKRIVVFGDSLTENGTTSKKSWTDYLSEITGAITINVAIGGTQLRQRREMVPLFKDSESYSVGDWVFYKPGDTMNCYECVNAHSGAWDDADFNEVSYGIPNIYSTLDIVNMVSASCDVQTPIEERFVNQIAAAECVTAHYNDNNEGVIARLKAINWSEIDCVIVLGGTNDYGRIENMGNTGSSDKNLTLGAINEIVRMICSTYKQVSLFFVTPCVHWKDYSNGSGLPENWCDNYSPSTMGMTRGKYYSDLLAEFAKNHISGLNLYNELGWNIFNFSRFFYLDGTHPTIGVGTSVMAKKIAGFLQANKAF